LGKGDIAWHHAQQDKDIERQIARYATAGYGHVYHLVNYIKQVDADVAQYLYQSANFYQMHEGHWLLVIGYWLLVIGYWLLVIGHV
jgi:hypothetical protein